MTITSVTVIQGIALQPGPQGDIGPQGPPGSISNLDMLRGWTTVQYVVPTDIAYVSGGTTAWDTAVNPNARLAISGGNTTMGAPMNVVEGAYYALRFVQDTPARTVTWDSHYHWAGGPLGAVAPSNIDAAIDVFHFRGAVGGVLEFVGAQLNIM
jgi:hypothetical protein